MRLFRGGRGLNAAAARALAPRLGPRRPLPRTGAVVLVSRRCAHSSSSSTTTPSPAGPLALLASTARAHSGTIYNFGMASSMMAFLATDILHLRCLSVLGTSCAIWFNYARAPPWNAVWWGLCFVSINLCQIGLLLQERSTKLSFSEDELEVFTQHFSRHKLEPRAFAKLLAAAEWRTYGPGELLLREGEASGELLLLHRGAVEVHARGHQVDRVSAPSPTAWLGELVYLEQVALSEAGQAELEDKHSPVSCRVATKASGGGEAAAVRALVWDKAQLQELLAKDDSVALAVNAIVAKTAVGKLRRRQHLLVDSLQARQAHYAEVLSAVLCDGVVQPEEKKMLREYREAHGIGAEQHAAALEAEGWSTDEFDDGLKAVFGAGDSVVIVKQGSHLTGQHATVVDVNWHGLVKVRVEGGAERGTVKSYLAADLEQPELEAPGSVSLHPPGS